MDADVVAAAGAAAATTRTPFDDDDDPEMIEDPTSAGHHGYYGNYAPSHGEYAPSTMSGGTAPGMAGMGAWGPAAGAAAGGAAAGAGAYGAYYGSQQDHSAAQHYYDIDPNAASYYNQGPMSGGHDQFSAGSHQQDMYSQGNGWSNGGYSGGHSQNHLGGMDGEGMPFADSVAAGLAANRGSNGGYDGYGGGDGGQQRQSPGESENLLGANVFSDPSPPGGSSPNHEDYSNNGQGYHDEEPFDDEHDDGAGQRRLQIRNHEG